MDEPSRQNKSYAGNVINKLEVNTHTLTHTRHYSFEVSERQDLFGVMSEAFSNRDHKTPASY